MTYYIHLRFVMKIFLAMNLAILLGMSPAHAAAICNGKWALVAHYTCDGSPMYGAGKCLLVGHGKNENGKWDPGDEFKIKFEDEQWTDVSHEKACTGDNAQLCDKPETAHCL